jgi:hypothetical protein
VRTRRLGPRGLAPPLTAQDRRAYALYAEATQRNADESIEVDNDAPAETDDDGPGRADTSTPVSPRRSGGPGAAA